MDPGIGVDGHQIFNPLDGQIEIVQGPNDGAVQFARSSSIMPPIEHTGEYELRIALPPIPRARIRPVPPFLGRSALYHDDVLETTSVLDADSVMDAGPVAGIGPDAGVFVSPLLIDDAPGGGGCGGAAAAAVSQYVRHDVGSAPLLPVSRNRTVAHHQQATIVVGVIRLQYAPDGLAQFLVSLVVARHHDHYSRRRFLLGQYPFDPGDVQQRT
mmetsp:Transcript_36290/g.108832  ORF Transcript_36290/g.108832 Transcript_36290/m.108832 type:complete len:213 (-) Transcript_36290:221-859(-)